MSVSRPNGYRMPRSIALTTLSRRIVAGGTVSRRDEAVRIVAAIAAQVIESADREAVFRRLSHGRLGVEQLAVSRTRSPSLVAYTAEFVDLLHSSMHHTFAVPVEPWLDLRFELSFFDDPADAESPWTYVLLGTESPVLEERWQQIEGVEPFPIPDPDDVPGNDHAEPELSARADIWTRVTDPFATSEPISWQAPELALLFDIIDSLADPAGDRVQAEQGKITVSLVADELSRRHGMSHPEAYDLLTAEESKAATSH